MANQNRVKLVLSHQHVLDAWREEHPGIRFDLSDHLFRPEKALNEGNMSDAILTHAILERTDLRKSILVRADLSFANLPDADMHKVDLRNANLWHTILSGTNLEDADLRDADLAETVFGNTRLLNTQLTGATGQTTITQARQSQMDADTLSKDQAFPEHLLLSSRF